MKKIIITILCIASAFMLASCDQQLEISVTPEQNLVQKTFTVDTDLTKAELDGLNVVWSPGDKIKIAALATQGSPNKGKTEGDMTELYYFTTTYGGAQAVFTGSLPDGWVTGTALFCHEVVNLRYASSALSARMNIPYEQTGVKNGISPDVLFLYAYTDGSTSSDIDFVGEKIHFKIGCCLIKVSVVGSDIKQISLSAEEYLASERFNFNLKSGNCSTLGATYGDDFKTLVMTPAGGLATFEPGDYYFSVVTKNGATRDITGLKVSYTKSDDTVWSITSDNTLSSTAGKIYRTGIDETKCTLE